MRDTCILITQPKDPEKTVTIICFEFKNNDISVRHSDFICAITVLVWHNGVTRQWSQWSPHKCSLLCCSQKSILTRCHAISCCVIEIKRTERKAFDISAWEIYLRLSCLIGDGGSTQRPSQSPDEARLLQGKSLVLCPSTSFNLFKHLRPLSPRDHICNIFLKYCV